MGGSEIKSKFDVLHCNLGMDDSPQKHLGAEPEIREAHNMDFIVHSL